MPLKIELKSGDKIIINGAVVENVGPSTRIIVHNESAILRQKEVLSDEESRTPASRVYYALQCAYIFPQKRADYLKLFDRYLRDYLKACPSAQAVVTDIKGEIEAGRIYKGLKKTHKLIEHEVGVLKAFERHMTEGLDEPTDSVSEAQGPDSP